jgi:hypothetical protein
MVHSAQQQQKNTYLPQGVHSHSYLITRLFLHGVYLVFFGASSAIGMEGTNTKGFGIAEKLFLKMNPSFHPFLGACR